ncbi:Bacterial membrane flanked domain protein [Rosistilla ulvae]|uniref:Bacterial membrane flanked domain protein n=1 Tax=Rosistilla ulvae TaxID=1930277 RepID=A0A517M1S4_9BACT|nr:PH domain-containing protein [Rosistilla ulvae]QDS88833.1 Bacterial membrane flanked domain protein [Rosistilla ulvae]
MTAPVARSSPWIYRGVWKILVDCFRVPDHPPTLPVADGDFYRSFQPSRAFLSYLKFNFWVVAVVIDLLIAVALGVVAIEADKLALVLTGIAIPLLLVGHLVAYIALHLRYDTMWYVITDRSLRARRGIWVIYEHTITFENVQNVYLRRGPLQHLFGISEIVVETAGSSQGEAESPFASGNKLLVQGIEDAAELREQIMSRVSQSRSAGLGDDRPASPTSGFSPRHLAMLCEIRDEIKCL